MKVLPLQGPFLDEVTTSLSVSPLFSQLESKQLQQVAERAELRSYDADEVLVTEGEAADELFVILSGAAAVRVGEHEVSTVGPPDCFGEMGMLLEQPRSATVRATERMLVLRYDARSFKLMLERVPGFSLALLRLLATRLHDSSRRIPLRDARAPGGDGEAASLLPIALCERHRVLPLSVKDDVLTVGFVDDPSREVLSAIRQHLPALRLEPVRISAQTFGEAMKKRGLDRGASFSGGAAPGALDGLLRRMIAEGASDLHLAAGHKPRWRIDGEIHEVEDAPVLGPDDVRAMIDPAMEPRHKAQYAEDNDTDLAHAIPGLARWRVNLYRDARGTGAVMRLIPSKVLSAEQLGLPPVVETLSDHPKGLVLVTGPTGSGKSTTLAAMIDRINRTKRAHIVTLEDPIEFMHESRLALVNQREVGSHTRTFARALRAALREDPNIVLVGEMRDLETINLALETASTGHLVFATLHTSTAIGTVDRIVDLFPGDQQNKVRATLADTLRGVIAQTLLRRVNGGRVAALEILVVNHAVSNLIRTGKVHQITNIMQTGKAQGNVLLNERLAELVFDGTVAAEEALSKAVDKKDLASRIGAQLPVEE